MHKDSIANDVEWPLFAEHRGFAVDYFPANGLVYRTREDFDGAVDAYDDDPTKWIARAEIANLHARVLARFLDAAGSVPPSESGAKGGEHTASP